MSSDPKVLQLAGLCKSEIAPALIFHDSKMFTVLLYHLFTLFEALVPFKEFVGSLPPLEGLLFESTAVSVLASIVAPASYCICSVMIAR